MNLDPFQKLISKGFTDLIPSPFTSNHSKKKRERKGKDQVIGRNYICGCGKSYLSYAALYTHTKTKHGGVFPSGTSTLKKPKSKKLEQASIESVHSFDINKSHEFNFAFISFLEMIPGAIKQTEEDCYNPVEDFPVERFSSGSNYTFLLKKMGFINKSLVGAYGGQYFKQFEWIMYEISMCRGLVCYDVFSLFLLYIYRFVSQEFYGEVAFLLLAYAQMLNKEGWVKSKELSPGFSISRNELFCSHQSAEILPDLTNEFFLNHFPKTVDSREILRDAKSLTFFGNDSVKILRAILVVKQLSNWLNIYGLSLARVEILKH